MMRGTKIGVLALCMLASSSVAVAQRKGGSPVFRDINKVIHFGFTFGTNASTFKYDPSPAFFDANANQFSNINIRSFPGLTLGAVVDLHLGSNYFWEHFNLRAIVPTLTLTTRRIEYTRKADNQVVAKDVESAYLEVPLLLKMKTDVFNNKRGYIISGLKYSYDMSSNAKSKQKKQGLVAVTPNMLSWEIGLGLDIYMPYFKFSPEIKFSKGLNNIFANDPADPYSVVFDRFRSNTLYLSLYFEG